MILRRANPNDALAIHQLIIELAVYEKEPDAVINTPEQLLIDLFEEKRCHAWVVENNEGAVLGFALYYFGYSTWKGKTIYLEDLYVKPEYRKQGIGELLFDAVVEEGKRNGVKRMDWQVLNWNEPAINFYKKKNALLDAEWINGRLFFD
jgi:GNAT superfamily N-acetyltransferase